jgi:shikimate kinase
MGDRVVLVGMMGAGKTTVGRQLAGRLGWRFFDSDAMVEESTGSTVAALFAAGGEAAFRTEESRVLVEALEADGPAVVSAAGGAVLDPGNRELLSTVGAVVWLRAEPATLAARVGTGAGRPLLDGDPAGALAELDAVRRPLYGEVADVIVDVDDLDASTVVDRILAATAFARTRPTAPRDPRP